VTGPVLSRRRLFGLGAAAIGSAALVAGCGQESAEAPPAQGAATGPAGAFPVTVRDKFGDVTIDAPPTTVASVGRTDHDVLLALGIVPATVYRFVPPMKRGVGKWAEARLGAAQPEILTNPISIEKVAAVRPNLVLNVQSTGDQAEYDTLTKIAPTVGLPPDTPPNTVSWQDSTRIIATAVGRSADGQKLVADTEAVLERTKAANPAFQGRTVSILLGSGGQLGGYSVGDTRTQVATGLGLAPSPYVTSLPPDKFFAPLSNELVNTADADVVVMLTREGLDRAAVLAQYPALAGSTMAREGRLAVVEDFNVSLAFAAGSVLSIPFAVDGLVPVLKTVLK
jgi:iron complex transport system substrate-binding protein